MDRWKFRMLRINVLKLISNELKVLARATGFSIPTCYVVRSFVCKDLSPYWFWVCQWHMGNFLVHEEHYTHREGSCLSYMHCMDRNQGTILKLKLSRHFFVSWITTMSGLWQSRKTASSSFLPLIPLIFMPTNFSPLRKIHLLIPGADDALFMSFTKGSKLFDCSKLHWVSK